MALGQQCRHLQEVGEEAWVVRWRRRWGWRRRQRLLQAVSLCAHSSRHHMRIWHTKGQLLVQRVRGQVVKGH